MDQRLMSRRTVSVLSGLSGVAGVVLLIVSFATAIGPPPDATRAELVKFGQQHYAGVLWGAWLQAVGPVFIVLFAFALVHLAGAALRLAGWMTLFDSLGPGRWHKAVHRHVGGTGGVGVALADPDALLGLLLLPAFVKTRSSGQHP